jgi:hypothetical protein
LPGYNRCATISSSFAGGVQYHGHPSTAENESLQPDNLGAFLRLVFLYVFGVVPVRRLRVAVNPDQTRRTAAMLN